MRGTGIESISSILDHIFGAVASLPDGLFYIVGALPVAVMVKRWFSTRPTAGRQSATTATQSGPSSPNPASGSRTNSNTPSERSTKQTGVQQWEPGTRSNDTTSTVSPETDHQSAVIEQATINSFNAHEGRTVLHQPVGQQSKHHASKPNEPETQKGSYTTSKHPRRIKYPTKTSSNSVSLRTQARRQFIDPIQIETGIDPVSWDPSWGLLKADFSLTGVSADTGGELVYFNVFPSPVSYNTFNSPIEVTTTSLIRHLLGTTAPSSSTNDRSTKQEPATSKRQYQKTETDQLRANSKTQSALLGEASGNPSRYTSPSSTQKPTDPEPHQSTPTEDPRPPFRNQTEYHESPTAGTPSDPECREHTQSRPTDDVLGDEATTWEETFNNPWFTTGDTPSNRNSYETIVEEPIFEPALDTDPSPAIAPPAFQSDQQLGPLGDSRMQAEEDQQVGGSSVTDRGERHSGEVIFDAATPASEPRNPFEDLQQGLDAVGSESQQLGFDIPKQDQDLWPEHASIDTASDPFGVSEAAERFDDEPLFPEANVNEPVGQEPDNMWDPQESLFDTEFRF